MFWSVVLMPVFLILSLIVDEPIPLFIPFAIFLIGLSLMLYARIFSEEMSNVGSQDTRPSSLGAMFRSSALPSASTSMANRADWQQVRTSELIEPPSVAEHTTKLLD
jgi:hypothetical protein